MAGNSRAGDGRVGQVQAGPAGHGTGGIETMISAKLRSYYDALVEEGTPDAILDLLEQLEAAERLTMLATGDRSSR